MWLREDSRRDRADNKSTIYLSGAGGGRGSVEMLSPQVFRDRFIRTYDPIYELVARCPRPGLAMVAVDHHGVAAAGYLAAKPRSINVGIVGRHTVADLFLDSDPSLSLRHLAVILHPTGPVDEPRLRLLDLRTSEAFKDERGRQLEGLETEGQAVISCGRYALYFFALEQDERWPEDAAAAWDCLPERVYFDDEPAEPDRWSRRRVRGRRPARVEQPKIVRPGQRRPTFIHALPGPALAHQRMLNQGEEPLGELRIRDLEGEGRIQIGSAALRSGVLIGRALRCDGNGLPTLRDQSISRVHLLVIEIAGKVYAIDAASSHGVRYRGEPVRLTRLDFGQAVELGAGLAKVSWHPLS
jgi:hypothetical protein